MYKHLLQMRFFVSTMCYSVQFEFFTMILILILLTFKKDNLFINNQKLIK